MRSKAPQIRIIIKKGKNSKPLAIPNSDNSGGYRDAASALKPDTKQGTAVFTGGYIPLFRGILNRESAG
jgi:hypothetical protein